MGFKSWLASAPVALFLPVELYKDRVEKDKEAHPLAGVTARVESGSDLQTRVTATRLLAIGVFAFAAKKKSGGEAYLTVEGPDFFWTVEVDRKKRSAAQAFAAQVNNHVRRAASD